MGTGVTAFAGLAADVSEFATWVVYQLLAELVSNVRFRTDACPGLLNQGCSAYIWDWQIAVTKERCESI
jgi:hypothetical protein